MSAIIPTLIVTIVGALGSAASLVGPPALPPEPAPESAPPSELEEQPEQGPEASDLGSDPDAVRPVLPPGLQPVPFPLEHQRHAPPTSGDGNAPAQERRSIVDLRDPFNRPPPRPRAEGQHDPVRLLLPDLKDPFAPGVRPVRSQTLDRQVPNDIRDPFRSPPPSGDLSGNRPSCTKTGQGKAARGECSPSHLDLRDPFDRQR